MVDAAQALKRALSYLDQKLPLIEQVGVARGPWLMMSGRGTARGSLRCFGGRGLDKVVSLNIDDGDQADTAMLFVFGSPHTAMPHLFVDAARVGRDYAVFVDLLPRVELAAEPAYTHAVYGPLHEVIDGLDKHPQLKPASVPHSLRPFVSPWMHGFRVHAQAMPQLFELIAPHVSHWHALLTGLIPLPSVEASPEELRLRDLQHRAGLFTREADPGWDALKHAVGDRAAAEVLGLLRTHGLPIAPSMRPPGP